jgi:hypothetical protein
MLLKRVVKKKNKGLILEYITLPIKEGFLIINDIYILKYYD